MKFMITWQLHPGKLADALEYFSQMTQEQESRTAVRLSSSSVAGMTSHGDGVSRSVNPTVPRPYQTGR